MRICAITGCDNAFHGRGMCRKHYMEWWRGSIEEPSYTPPLRPTVEERFWAKVDIGQADQCWLWQASKTPNGYGQFYRTTAHRWSYRLTHPEKDISGLHIDHLCRRLDCVNPNHLEAVSPSVNHRRGYAVNVMAALRKEQAHAATHCRNGHERTSENTYIAPNGWRSCRICKAIWTTKKRRAK